MVVLNKTLILILFLSFSLYSQNNQGRIVYGKQITADFSNSPISSVDNSNSNGETGLEYELFFTRNEAQFSIVESMGVDSDKGHSFSKTMGGGKGIYYFNSKNKNNLRQFQAFGEEFLLSDYLTNIKWTITKDTMTIGNMLCYKATSVKTIVRTKNTFKKPITAWFTLNIPLSYGPIGYNGLPGLILDLNIENEVRFYAKKIEFLNSVKIKEPTQGNHMTAEEFENKSKALSRAHRESLRSRYYKN